MIIAYLIYVFASATAVLSAPKDLRLLFPQDKQYIYEITASLSSGTLDPKEASTSWTLEGRLFVQVFGNVSQVRYQLGDLKTSVDSKHDGYISYQFEGAAKHLKLPWIVDYHKELCLVESVYLPSEPAWVSNVKKALSLNFQLKKEEGYYTNYETCVHDDNCFSTYLSHGSTVTKYTSPPSSPKLGASWRSVPWIDPSCDRSWIEDQGLWNTLPDSTTMTAERVYKLDEKTGLVMMEMKERIRYKADGRTLFLNTELQIQYETELQAARLDWPKLTRTGAKYNREECEEPSCGIQATSQAYLKNRTYEILLKISKTGIDADNIVEDPSMVHANDFMQLLNTMSQLNHTTLKLLFEDLVLGTSYELETCRNIFLEVVPYAGTEAAVRFVKFLVVEEAGKIEDSALLSLVRKLPFNGANYSQQLLQELEPFTKLGLDSNQELRHAAILSFGTMLHHAKKAERVGADYFDSMVVKYLRMYSDCPHYMDRLVWLQGLCNIGGPTQKYTMEIYTDPSKKRNERLWAAFASDYTDNQFYMNEPLKTTEYLLPVLVNETENIQIRMAALHGFLTATTMTQNDLLFVHSYVKSSGNPQMKRFWYTALKSLEENKHFDGYKLASFFLPSVSDMVFDLDPDHWATNNVIFRSEEDPTTTVHLLSMADDTGLPAFAGIRLATAGKKASVYIAAEGVASNVYKRMHAFDHQEMNVDKLIELLKELKVWAVKSSEDVHVDFVFKMNEKAVFVAHMNQTRFDSWNLIELARTVNEFLRMGSHINQQVAHYPSNLQLIFPNELGIPVRLQSTSMSFASVRGNLTAPATDLHIRYQAMSLTSLSSYGPMVHSEHSARIQKSVIAHLPIKFNVSHTPVGVWNLKTDFFLPIQNGGVVIHTRTQVEKTTRDSVDLYTVRSREENQTNTQSIFSECNNSIYEPEIENLLTTNAYSIFKYLRPSRLLLKAIPLMVSPPAFSCDVIRLHFPQDTYQGVKATVLIENLPSVVDFFSGDKNELKASLLLTVYREDSETSTDVLGTEIMVVRSQEKTIVTRVILNVTRGGKMYQVCSIENKDYIYTGDEDIALNSRYKTHITWNFGDTNTKVLDLFIDAEKKADGVRTLTIKSSHDLRLEWFALVENLRLLCEQLMEKADLQLPQELWVRLHFACTFEPFVPIQVERGTELSAVLKDGLTTVDLDKGSQMRLKSADLIWLVDYWMNLKKMSTFGLYKECRIRGSTVQTLSGQVRDVSPMPGETAVALADCTDVPRFAVLRQSNGGLKVFAGGHYVSIYLEDKQIAWKVNSTKNGNHFRILKLANGVQVQSRGSGVQVYYRPGEATVLVPNSHLESVCGFCAGP